MTLSPTMRGFLAVAGILSAVVAGKRLVESFAADELYRKDFVQEYTFAKAVLAGDDPYRPMPEMVKAYVDSDTVVNWAHPAPHTPVTAVLSTPLAALPYEAAAFLWLISELALVVVCWGLFFRWWDEPIPWPTRAVLVLLSFSLGPLIQELWFGNLSLILLAILLAAWLALREGRDFAGGLWLGLAIAIKLTGWPIGVWLLLKGRWKAVVAAGGVVLGLHLIAMLAMGPEHVLDYYLRVGPAIARGYKQHDCNYSLWTIGPRLFAEYDSVFNSFVALAPFSNESVSRLLGLALPIFGLIVGLGLAFTCRQFDSAFGVLLCASLLVNPVAWDHSLLVASIAMAVVFKRLSQNRWPRAETIVSVACFALAMFPQQGYMRPLAEWFGVLNASQVRVVPFVPGLATYLPLTSLLGWICLLKITDRRYFT